MDGGSFPDLVHEAVDMQDRKPGSLKWRKIADKSESEWAASLNATILKVQPLGHWSIEDLWCALLVALELQINSCDFLGKVGQSRV